MKKGEYWFPYWGALVLKTIIPVDLGKKLLAEDKKNMIDYRHELAGMIDIEYAFKDYEDWFFPKFMPLLEMYQDEWIHGWKGTCDYVTPFQITSSDLWINHQKKGEHNPRHYHTGDLSFVIYLKIPEKLKQENTKQQAINKNHTTGTIKFHYGENLPFSRFHHEEMPNDNEIFIFPAWLQHSVSPFFSDVERISVSGNIFLQKK